MKLLDKYIGETTIEAWALKQDIKILVVQETKHAHSSQEGGRELINWDNVTRSGYYKWFFSSSIDPKHHGNTQKPKRKRGKQTKNYIITQ